MTVTYFDAVELSASCSGTVNLELKSHHQTGKLELSPMLRTRVVWGNQILPVYIGAGIFSCLRVALSEHGII